MRASCISGWRASSLLRLSAGCQCCSHCRTSALPFEAACRVCGYRHCAFAASPTQGVAEEIEVLLMEFAKTLRACEALQSCLRVPTRCLLLLRGVARLPETSFTRRFSALRSKVTMAMANCFRDHNTSFQKRDDCAKERKTVRNSRNHFRDRSSATWCHCHSPQTQNQHNDPSR